MLTFNLCVCARLIIQGDTWYVDIAQPIIREWRRYTTGPSPGVRHGAAAVSYHKSLYVHGGSTVAPVNLFDDLWRFIPAEGWTLLHPGSRLIGAQGIGGLGQELLGIRREMGQWPRARSYHASALLPGTVPRMILFGGANCTGSCICFNDVWAWTLENAAESEGWEQLQPALDLDTRYHHSLVAHEGSVYTFGGESYVPHYMYHNSVAALQLEHNRSLVLWLVGLVGAGVAFAIVGQWWSKSGRGRKQKL